MERVCRCSKVTKGLARPLVKPGAHRATHFRGGETAGWWVKCVQMDLEAKGVLKRGRKGRFGFGEQRRVRYSAPSDGAL